jgi:L-fuconolactonase
MAAAIRPRPASAQQRAAPTSGVRQDWLDRHKEAVIEPDLPIIDPHHHLWLRPGSRYLFEDYLQDAGSGHNLVATVFVQCRSMYRTSGPVEMRPVGEVEFVNGVAAMSASGLFGKTRVATGIVGQADLTLGARVEPVLAAEVRAGGSRLRGIRHIAAWDGEASLRTPAYPAPRGLLRDKTFREGFATLSRFGLAFETWIYHPQLDDLADLARAFPGTKILIDHSGGPLGVGPYRGKRDEVFARWSASIKALAKYPNVFIKVGGLGQSPQGFNFNELTEPPSSQILADAFRPHVETCIEAFGASRSMFESNFPVDKVSYSYLVFWNTCKLLAKNASTTEKADLFAGTARRFYQLDMSG